MCCKVKEKYTCVKKKSILATIYTQAIQLLATKALDIDTNYIAVIVLITVLQYYSVIVLVLVKYK